ncbi:MAG: DUF6488 family protein [Campylobacterota bacterium]
MTKLIKILLTISALSFTTLQAKSGYDYYYYGNDGSSYTKLNKSAIMKIAKVEIKRLTMEKKIPKSWRSVAVSKISKSNSDDWRVIFENLKIKDKSKQNIYVFVGVYGKVKGVNYTGR